ncbi:MAG: hypothetical protein ACLS69_05780 [Butyricicoccus sp.]
MRGLSNYRMLIYAIPLIAMMLFNNSPPKVARKARMRRWKRPKSGGKKEGA